MTKLPNDDQNLVDFLRQNRPEIPPANPELEERIFQAIASSPLPQLQNNSPNRFFRRRQLWLVPPAIAASLALVWAGNYWRESYSFNNSLASKSIVQNSDDRANNNLLAKSSYLAETPNSQNHQELAKLETFLENNWNGVVTSNPPEISVETIQREYFNLAESKSYSTTKATNVVTTRR